MRVKLKTLTEVQDLTCVTSSPPFLRSYQRRRCTKTRESGVQEEDTGFKETGSGLEERWRRPRIMKRESGMTAEQQFRGCEREKIPKIKLRLMHLNNLKEDSDKWWGDLGRLVISSGKKKKRNKDRQLFAPGKVESCIGKKKLTIWHSC